MHIGGTTSAINPRILRDSLIQFGIVEEFIHIPASKEYQTSAFVVFGETGQGVKHLIGHCFELNEYPGVELVFETPLTRLELQAL